MVQKGSKMVQNCPQMKETIFFIQKHRNSIKMVRWRLCIHHLQFPDFQRFLLGKVLLNSDFFDETFLSS